MTIDNSPDSVVASDCIELEATIQYEDWGEEHATAAEYQGKKVTLSKPFRTPGKKKKFAVYVKNSAGKVIIVRFGDPNMEIKRDDPKRRKAFRDRHDCANKKDRTTPGYWSCRQWRSSPVEAVHIKKIYSDKESSTPAPPKDRRKGSNKNPKDSAKDSKGGVTFSESVTKSLKTKVSEHNKKSEKKVTLGMLKAVYRRGAGAFSTSHRPGVSRAAWSMARVNAFLKLVRSGKPSNPKYVQDNDLLPKNHGRKSKKASEEDCGCGSDCCDDETVEAEQGSCQDGYEQFGMKMKNGAKVPNCVPVAEAMTLRKKYGAIPETEEVEAYMKRIRIAAEPTPKDDETHDQYMSRCEAAGYTSEECMAAHKGHTFKEDASYDDDEDKMKASEDCCPIGEELVAGICQPVNVTMEITIDEVIAKVEAKTGKSIIEISGIAFHEGMNKNNWSLTRKGADVAMAQMVGADLTLNHPKPTKIGFSRNMDGGIDEAVVGFVTEASLEELEAGKWNVRYKAQVQRTELFEALESGLWLRSGYGVSIGGYGVPIQANDDGMVFESDFTFDHLAIVHKPAYNRANIEEVNKIKPMAASQDDKIIQNEPISASTFKYQPDSATGYQTEGFSMDEDIINEEMGAVASEALAEAEALKADLILAQATIAEYKAIEAKKIEDTRLSLVASATEMGLKGHEDLSSETIESLIASWKESRPSSEPTEMKSVEPAVASESPAPVQSEAVVANFLNGRIIETPESVYERAYNAWASAWNKTLSGVEARNDRFKAPNYEEIKEMI
mgnify:CR=1 FL=1